MKVAAGMHHPNDYNTLTKAYNDAGNLPILLKFTASWCQPC